MDKKWIQIPFVFFIVLIFKGYLLMMTERMNPENTLDLNKTSMLNIIRGYSSCFTISKLIADVAGRIEQIIQRLINFWLIAEINVILANTSR